MLCVDSFQIFGLQAVCFVKTIKSAEMPNMISKKYHIPVLGDITAIAPADLPSRFNPPKATLYGSPGHATVN